MTRKSQVAYGLLFGAALAGAAVYAQSAAQSGRWVLRPAVKPSGDWTVSTAERGQSSSQGPVEPGVRRLDRLEVDKPLRQQLRPEDRTIEWLGEGDDHSGPTDVNPDLQLKGLLANSTFAGVLQVLSVEGREEIDSTFGIVSTVTARVVKVLATSPNQPLTQGDTLSFEVEGGEVAVGQSQRVRARRADLELPKMGHPYLAFLFEYRGRLWPVSRNSFFELEGKRLKPLLRKKETVHALEGADEDWATALILAEAALRPGGARR